MKPFFISIPHSGERVPTEAPWLQGLPEPVLMCDVDRYVDKLYSPIVDELRLACVKTQWHRYVVDLNRDPADIDDEAVEKGGPASGKFASGLHWVKTTRGTRLMPQPMSQATHRQLVDRYYNPFHEDVREMFSFFRERGAKKVFHLDAHSMPSVGTGVHKDPGQTRKDVVVSDCSGRACDPAFKDIVIDAYTKAGLEVAYNWPYVGGGVTERYGQPTKGQNTLQVELSRALYMDEETKTLVPDKAKALSEKLALAIRTIHERLPEG